MKKLFITALAAIAIGTSAFAGPSTSVKDHFARNFSKAENVSWKSTDEFDRASFIVNNESVNVFYDKSGALIGTSKKVAFDKLPKDAIETITTKYTFPEFQVKECIQFTNNSNDTNYYVSLDNKGETVVLEINKKGTVSIFAGQQ